MTGCWHGLEVPPPCPVDDTPFTACTPESVALQKARELALAQGRSIPPGTQMALLVRSPLPPAAAPAPQPVTFSTKTYRRNPPLRADRPHPKPPRKP